MATVCAPAPSGHGTISNVPVILLLAAAAILGGVVWAALGRAGEMATFPGDCAPLDVDEVTPADVALLHPPQALWGYHVQATEEALQIIARSLTARDVEIANLRRELADLRASQAGQWPAPGLGQPPGPGERYLGRAPASGEGQLGQRPAPGEGYFGQQAAPGEGYLGPRPAAGGGYFGQRPVAGVDQDGGNLPPWPAVPGPGHDD